MLEQERRMMDRMFYLRDKGPVPRILEAKERSEVGRFLRTRPALIEIPQEGLERFLGQTSVLSDGRLLLVFLGQPNQKSGNPLSFLVWGSVFGGCLRLSMRMRPHPKQAVLIPSDPEFAALKLGRVVVSFWRLGKLEMAYELDYRREDHAEALAEICRIAEENTQAIFNNSGAFWDRERLLANSVSETFQDWFTRLEWLQLGWIKESRNRIPRVIKIVADLPDFAKRASEWEALQKYPVMRRVLGVASQSGPARERLPALLTLFTDAQTAMRFYVEAYELFDRLGQENEEVVRAFKTSVSRLMHVWNVQAWDPKVSDWGRRQHYIDGPRKAVGFYNIEADGFSLSSDKEAQSYWQWLQHVVLFDAPAYLDPSDMPVNPKMVFEAWASEVLEINLEEAAETIKNLLDEANGLRQWTIPTRVEVKLKVGPFASVELTEVGDEVYFVWRASDRRYWLTSVSVRTQSFVNDVLADPRSHGLIVQAALRLLMAALIRDFWVVEERHRIFDVQIEKVPRTPRGAKTGRRVVYLPRIKYISSGMHLGRLSKELEHVARARHYVRPFFRTVERPSPLQLEIARRHAISVPAGHTYVRGHYRGGGKRQTVYRSRSALNLLYEIVSPSTLSSSLPMSEDWFAFERAVAMLLECNLNFRIVDRSVRGKGDQGIDILATKLVGGRTELWIVQCKHYGHTNPIGPRIIRELLGSSIAVGHDEDQVVRTMLVTTGRISGDALKLVASHGVQTYDGTQLAAICAAVNRNSWAKLPAHPTA
jgi:hypothetical protein